MSSFKLNYKGLGRFLCSQEIREDMERRAKNIEARAIAIAPVGRNDRTVGQAKTKVKRYKDSFKVTSGVAGRPRFLGRRAYARVENTKTYAVFVEYGRKKVGVDKDGKQTVVRQNAHRTLGRAVDAARD